MFGEEEEEEEERGEVEEVFEPLPTTFEDVTKALTQTEAGECLHTLGKCESGLGYAYLGLDASNRGLTNINIIPMFKYVLYVNVSGNRLNNEALRVLSSMTYLLMLQADKNEVESAELDPMPYLQVNSLLFLLKEKKKIIFLKYRIFFFFSTSFVGFNVEREQIKQHVGHLAQISRMPGIESQ